ncbi:MAG: hypothetical protein WKF45_09750 [Ilumatobacteraceae bacterium]
MSETAQRAGSEAGTLVHLLDAPELADAIPAISRLIARCESVKLNAVHCADLLHVGDLVGARSTSEWVADVTGTKPGTARKDLDVAARLDDLPVLDEALADGTTLDVAATGSVGGLDDTVKQFRVRKHLPTGEVVKGVTITRNDANVRADVVLDPLGGDIDRTSRSIPVGLATFLLIDDRHQFDRIVAATVPSDRRRNEPATEPARPTHRSRWHGKRRTRTPRSRS